VCNDVVEGAKSSSDISHIHDFAFDILDSSASDEGLTCLNWFAREINSNTISLGKAESNRNDIAAISASDF